MSSLVDTDAMDFGQKTPIRLTSYHECGGQNKIFRGTRTTWKDGKAQITEIVTKAA